MLEHRCARINLQVVFWLYCSVLIVVDRPPQYRIQQLSETACRTTPFSRICWCSSSLPAHSLRQTLKRKTNWKLFGKCFCHCRMLHYCRIPSEASRLPHTLPNLSGGSIQNHIHNTQFYGKVSWYRTISTHRTLLPPYTPTALSLRSTDSCRSVNGIRFTLYHRQHSHIYVFDARKL